MNDHKTYSIPPAASMEKIYSHSAQVMTEYYSKGMIGGCSNLAWPHEDTNKELANRFPAENRSQTEVP